MKKLKILMLEDNKLDAKLIKEELIEHKFDFTSKCVETKKDFIKAINNFKPDIILSDYSLPQFTGFEALKIAKKLAPDIPFIFVTGSLSEESAVDSMKAGAWDYVIKENLLRLTPAIENALKLKEEKNKNRQAEMDLRIERDNMESIFEAMEDGVYLTDQHFNIQYVNPVLKKDFGSYRGKKCYNYFHDRTEVCPWCKNSEVFAGKTVRWEWYSSKNGKTYDLLDTPLKNSDGKISKLEIFRDITERKQAEEALKESEEKLRLMIDNSPIGFSATDLKGNFIEVNPAVCDMIGYSSEEILHKHFNQFSHPDDRAQNKELYKKLLENKIPHFDLEKRYIHKNGSIVNVLIRSQIVRDDEGKPLFEMAITEDITKRKLAEDQVKQDLKIKTALLQELYHRTKNNMQVIISMLKIQSRNLENRSLTENEGIDYLHDSLYNVINKVKAMSLVHEKLYQAKDLSHINLKEYIGDLVKYLMRGYNIRTDKVILNMELDEVFVLIDSAIPLGLVLNEIISNVFKHAFPHTKNDELFIKLYKEKDETIHIQLNDNGVGIPNDFDLKNVSTMGMQTVFSLTEYQLMGKVKYDTKKGLKWHISFKDDRHKERV